jgi:hypothetical protein
MLPLYTAIIFLLFAGGVMMDSQNFVPGEALVQFRAGSPAAAAVETAQGATPPDLSSLGPVLETAGARVRIPLKAVRPAGGSWLLLRVEADLLAKRTAEGLRKRREIRSVALVPVDSAFFEAGSQACGLLVELAPDRSPYAPEDPAALIASFSNQFGLPFSGGFHEKGILLLEIDWKELTRVLVERLTQLDDVEAAQPNFILGIRPPA